MLKSPHASQGGSSRLSRPANRLSARARSPESLAGRWVLIAQNGVPPRLIRAQAAVRGSDGSVLSYRPGE